MKTRALNAQARELAGAKGCTSANNFNVLITKQGCSNCSFRTFLNSQPSPSDLKQVLFMVLYTLEVMRRKQVSHNDLHLANMLVADNGKPVAFQMHPGVAFLVTSQAQPLFFDWDHAYVAALGPNPFLTEAYCQRTQECNRDNSNYDLFKFLCSVSKAITGKYPEAEQFIRRFMADCVSQRPVSLMDTFRDPYFASLQTRDTGSAPVFRLP